VDPFPSRLGVHVSYCRVGARLVFLDLLRDRYVCLTGDAEQSFRRLASGAAPRGEDAEMLAQLVEDGLLERSSGASRPLLACGLPPTPVKSLLESDCRPSGWRLAHASWRLAMSLAAFRARSLARSLDHLMARKRRLGARPADPEPAAAEIAAAFQHLQLLFAPLDRCLPHSLAIAHALIDRGIRPDLVIGVKLRPFAAHCWVQHHDVLINDTLDHARTLTPILVA
jgi:hypothetical protein